MYEPLSVACRLDALESLRDGIAGNESLIMDALHEDLGKCRTEAYMTEVGMTLSGINYTLKHLRKWCRPKKVHTPLAQFPASSRIIPEPYGRVLIMSPWNYPLLLCMSPLASAVAAGNTVVLKPSAYSPATSSVISKIVGEALPSSLACVVEGGRDVNSRLLDERFDYIFFTGSKAVGRLVMEKAAAHLTPVTLELGGKSPVIVTQSHDLKTSAARIVFGKYLNCGQTCVAPDYVLVQESVAGDFVEACRTEIVKMYGPSPLTDPDYGKIVNRKHFDRLCRLMDEVRDGLVHGGGSDGGTLKIEPSIIRCGDIRDRDCDAPGIMQEEIFGPLMPVLTYGDIGEAVDYVNSHPKPLAAYIFSGRKDEKEELTRRMHFGGGCVNDTIIHLASEHLPFGGVGESGMGRYHGKFGFDTFTHLKSIVDKPSWLDLPMRYQPFTALKDRLIRAFLK